jgi:hypothetical protein
VFVNGLTIFEPDEYVYVVAPDGDIVKDCPVQITPEFTVIVGVVLTTTVLTTVLEPGQPNALVPVMVYEVVTVGLTIAEPPV